MRYPKVKFDAESVEVKAGQAPAARGDARPTKKVPKKPKWPAEGKGSLSRCAFCNELVHLKTYRWIHEKEKVRIAFAPMVFFLPKVMAGELPRTCEALRDLSQALAEVRPHPSPLPQEREPEAPISK